jgi:hypothetical protein
VGARLGFAWRRGGPRAARAREGRWGRGVGAAAGGGGSRARARGGGRGQQRRGAVGDRRTSHSAWRGRAARRAAAPPRSPMAGLNAGAPTFPRGAYTVVDMAAPWGGGAGGRDLRSGLGLAAFARARGPVARVPSREGGPIPIRAAPAAGGRGKRVARAQRTHGAGGGQHGMGEERGGAGGQRAKCNAGSTGMGCAIGGGAKRHRRARATKSPAPHVTSRFRGPRGPGPPHCALGQPQSGPSAAAGRAGGAPGRRGGRQRDSVSGTAPRAPRAAADNNPARLRAAAAPARAPSAVTAEVRSPRCAAQPARAHGAGPAPPRFDRGPAQPTTTQARE